MNNPTATASGNRITFRYWKGGTATYEVIGFHHKKTSRVLDWDEKPDYIDLHALQCVGSDGVPVAISSVQVPPRAYRELTNDTENGGS